MTEDQMLASKKQVERGEKLLAERRQLGEIYNRVEQSNAVMFAALNSGFQMVTYAAHGSLDWDKAGTFLGFKFPDSLGFDVKTELQALRTKLLATVMRRMEEIDKEFNAL